MSDILLVNANALSIPLADESVHMCVTSPPYYSLRDYQVAGQIGLEASPEVYVERMVEVFREVWRVLRPEGTLWLNLGDSYAGSGGAGGDYNEGGLKEGQPRYEGTARIVRSKRMERGSGRWGGGNSPASGVLKPKDLVGIPWRVAFALQADGWWLRSEITWIKKAPMPECLSPDTKVFIRDRGTVKQTTLDTIHENAEPYPEILTPSGWKPIKKAWEVFKDEAVTFEAAKSESITCSLEHLWPISHDRRRVVTHEKPAAELRDNGYNDYLLYCTIGEHLQPSITHYDLTGDQLDYNLGWLLGLYAAEGGFGDERGHRCKITMSAEEDNILDRAEQIAYSRFGVPMARRKIKNYQDLRFSSPTWHSIASAFIRGNVYSKTINLDLVLNTPQDFRQGLWDGYMAGDGSNRAKGTIAISASRSLRDDMAVIASSLGIITSKGTRRQLDPRTGKTYVSFGLWTPYIERRQNKKESNLRQITIRNKRTIQGYFRMIDLEVEGGLFLIGDGLVTHNSVTDRPTSATEKIFLLAKSERYFYDAEAVREENSSPKQLEHNTKYAKSCAVYDSRAAETGQPGNVNNVGIHSRSGGIGRNMRNYWILGPEPYPGSHYAVFPTELPRRAIRAGTSEYGVCSECGAPYRRIVERDTHGLPVDERTGRQSHNGQAPQQSGWFWKPADVKGEHWQPTCPHADAPVVPATVLDPFAGSGTSLLVARQLGRHAVGLDLSFRYLHDQARSRLQLDALDAWGKGKPAKAGMDDLPLFARPEEQP